MSAETSSAPLRLLAAAREDREGTRRALARLSPEEQVALVCETPVARRGELLDLLPEPERVIPKLPEAELCFTVKAVGLHDAGWILQHARAEQLVASLDLDTWEGDEPSLERLDAWVDAYADAGEETLVRVAQAVDFELLVLWLRHRVEVWIKPQDEGWSPPVGSHTLDGRFYVRARREKDDLAALLRLLQSLFQHDYWFYFRLLQAALWELETETAEWAFRWRSGRLQDLGFPPREEAIGIYARVRPGERAHLPDDDRLAGLGEWPLPVWLPELPLARDAAHSLFRAAAELGDRERRALFYTFVALANQVAVADGLPLGDVESLPRAIEKAARLASRGLDALAAERGLPAAEVLRRAPVVWLFRVGHSLDRDESGS